MAITVVMPQMGYDMREGTVVRWRKQEGEGVSRGDVIAEIETDKATVEMEAYSNGVLGRIVVEEGKTVPVGELIAVITEPGEQVPSLDQLGVEAPGSAPASTLAVSTVAEQRSEQATPTATPASTEVRASPIARRLARERGIDLSQVQGTGPGGRVTESDILAHQGQPPAVTQDSGERIELTRMRQAIARVTAQSKNEAPHFYITSEIDMTQALALRVQLNDSLQSSSDTNEGRADRVSVNDMVVKAVAKALTAFPKFNASFQGDHLQLHPDLNIGIAIALEQGLMVPSISACQTKSLVEIAGASSSLIERAQAGTLRAEEYGSGTFSISNLGMFEVDSFAAIIFPPNAAVLAIGTVKEQPVVREGQIVIGHVMHATLSVDHRVADGAEGAQFLVEVKHNLEQPVGLLL